MLTTMINFCSNDARFISYVIESAAPFSDEVIVPVCDHFYDGEPENRVVLDEIYARHPNVRFVEFAYDTRYAFLGARYWTNMARQVGIAALRDDCEWGVFLDSDEVVDTDTFSQWLDSGVRDRCVSMRPVNYWYFREDRYQATTFEASALVVRRDQITHQGIFSTGERHGLHEFAKGKKDEWALSADGRPMIHHYSWVRSQEEMLKKVRSWGHNLDKDWEALVRDEFSRPFDGKDFVHGYSYREVSGLPDKTWVTPERLVPVETRSIADMAPLHQHYYEQLGWVAKWRYRKASKTNV